jgi:hypothetical protein
MRWINVITNCGQWSNWNRAPWHCNNIPGAYWWAARKYITVGKCWMMLIEAGWVTTHMDIWLNWRRNLVIFPLKQIRDHDKFINIIYACVGLFENNINVLKKDLFIFHNIVFCFNICAVNIISKLYSWLIGNIHIHTSLV